jgi:hypothetical protein
MYETVALTSSTDRKCALLSPRCNFTQWETIAASPTNDRECKAITNVTMYLDMDYDVYASSLAARVKLEQQVRGSILALTSPEVVEAVFRVLFARGSIFVVMQMLSENTNAIQQLRNAIALKKLTVKDNDGQRVAASTAQPSSSNSGAMTPIVAGAVGGAVLLVILVAVVLLHRRRARQSKLTVVESLTNYNSSSYQPESVFTNPVFFGSASEEPPAYAPDRVIVPTDHTTINSVIANYCLNLPLGEQERERSLYSSLDHEKNFYFLADGDIAGDPGALYAVPVDDPLADHAYVVTEDTSSALYQLPMESGNLVEYYESQGPRGRTATLYAVQRSAQTSTGVYDNTSVYSSPSFGDYRDFNIAPAHSARFSLADDGEGDSQLSDDGDELTA